MSAQGSAQAPDQPAGGGANDQHSSDSQAWTPPKAADLDSLTYAGLAGELMSRVAYAGKEGFIRHNCWRRGVRIKGPLHVYNVSRVITWHAAAVFR